MNTIVGFAGRKGAGKDTAAAMLISEGYRNIKFATPLKDMLRSYLGYRGVSYEIIERMVEGDLKEVPTDKLCGKTPRFFMQRIGTDFGRDMIGDTIWTDALKDHAALFDKVVCTDVRFPNEVATISEMGGVVIRVFDPKFEPPAGEHQSEALIDTLETTFVVANNKNTRSIASLHAHIEWLLTGGTTHE